MPDVLPVTRRDVDTAARLFAQYGPEGVKARDVIHAAVMQNNGLSTIISTDTHFDQLPSLECYKVNYVLHFL